MTLPLSAATNAPRSLSRHLPLLGLALGVLSIPLRWLSLPGLFVVLLLLLLGHASSNGPNRVWRQFAVVVATLSTAIGLYQFVRLDAVPGIVQGGEQAVMKRAVSHLREILRVEDALRKNAAIDPDGDGRGSMAFIGELSGSVPPRSGKLLRPPLNRRFQTTQDTPIGKAALIDGYYFIVCLPAARGGYTADGTTPVDDERSERQFLAYAWPEAESRSAYSIDAEDEILTRPPRVEGRPTYSGQMHPPDCSATLRERERDGWTRWRGKKPRASETP